MKASKIPLAQNERLVKIAKEYHIRKQGGYYLCYIVEDKTRNVLLIGQKISDLCCAVNDYVIDKPDKVSVAGLYQIAGVYRDGQRCGGWTKHRWRCTPVPIEKAAETFNSTREGFQHAIVLGSKECYSTACV